MPNLYNVCYNQTTFKLPRTTIQNKPFAVNISDTPVTLKQSQGHQTYNDNVDPKQVLIMQSLKDLALMVSKKKQTIFFLMRKYVTYLPWT